MLNKKTKSEVIVFTQLTKNKERITKFININGFFEEKLYKQIEITFKNNSERINKTEEFLGKKLNKINTKKTLLLNFNLSIMNNKGK